ncbi:MAG TPA: PEP-CTERM sorting domain-containing protein [Terriglobales bacterium]|nr:PEP-CTERM sorting domain-containing protein [Terriglobales bacterium]
MKRRNGLTLAAVVLLFSACTLASTIPDPGGIIRRGSGYTTDVAVIEPDLSIKINGVTPVTFPFNPFTASFCPIVSDVPFDDTTVSGPDCRFLNESGQTINSILQVFTADGSAFADAGGLSCFNDITGTVCPTPNGNSLSFLGLGIPSAEEYSSGGYGTEGGVSPFFNIINFGFDGNENLAQISSLVIPEPASLGLMLSGLFGLGLVWKRKARAKNR